MLIHLLVVYGCLHSIKAQSLKYLLAGSLQKEFSDPSSRGVGCLLKVQVPGIYHRSETGPRRQYVKATLVDSNVKLDTGTTDSPISQC